MNETIYQMLMVGTPILLAILGFIGALAVNALIKMGKDLNDIKIIIREISTKHEGLEKRVEHLEEKVL